MHYLNHKENGKTGWALLKLDIAKGYNRMEWNFLETIMLRLGFDFWWVQLIMNCVTMARYRVLVNGKLSNLIIPSWGIRKGDPLSPYLFLIDLSYLLQK